MLLKRQEKDDVVKAMYNSSNVIASIYDKKTNDLTIIFNKGGRYKYPKVTLSDYNKLELAESQGAVFNKVIKNYGFEKLSDLDPKEILEEIEGLKEAEKKALLLGKANKLTTVFNNIIKHEQGHIYTDVELKPVQDAITEYLIEYAKK